MEYEGGKAISELRKWLSHPLTRGLDIDDPRVTELRCQIIRKKSFLRQIYQEWYEMIATGLPGGEGPILELGSGAGFLSDFIPGLITSDIFLSPKIRVVLDGCQLPFSAQTLRGIVMTDVFHHLSRPQDFLAEVCRCVRMGGAIVMIEPWVTPWSRLIYSRLHHEPFDPGTQQWELTKNNPLSSANAALPWIVFERDRSRFEREFPMWHILKIKPFMPFRYLVSGGVSLRNLMPGWTFGLWRKIDNSLQPWIEKWAMFAEIVVIKVDSPAKNRMKQR